MGPDAGAESWEEKTEGLGRELGLLSQRGGEGGLPEELALERKPKGREHLSQVSRAPSI